MLLPHLQLYREIVSIVWLKLKSTRNVYCSLQMRLHKCNNIPYILLPLNLSFSPLNRSLFSQLFQSSVHWDWYNIFLPQLATSNCFCTWEFGSGSWKKWAGESVRGCLANAAVLMDAEGYEEDKVDSSKATLTKSMQKHSSDSEFAELRELSKAFLWKLKISSTNVNPGR